MGTATNSNTNTDKTDPLSSFAGICVGSSLGNPDGVSAQELEVRREKTGVDESFR